MVGKRWHFKSGKPWVPAFVTACLLILSPAQGMASPAVVDVTGIAHVFGNGEEVTDAVFEYSQSIDPASVSPDDYQVAGRTIEKVHVGPLPFLSGESRNGRYVRLELKRAVHTSDMVKKQASPWQKDGDPGSGVTVHHSDRVAPDLTVKAAPVGPITTETGEAIPGNSRYWTASRVRQPDLARFRQCIYHDPASGID